MRFPTRQTIRGSAAIALCAAIAFLASCSDKVAAGGGPAPIPMISVSGHGEAKGTPDEAQMSAGVVSEGRTAADALAANARAMNQVFATLKRLGIPDKNIQTSNFASNRNTRLTSRTCRSPNATSSAIR